MHIQGEGTEVNRSYGIVMDTRTKKLDLDTRTWLHEMQKLASLRSLADTDQKYFSCQARILVDKCHIQISGATHNRPYGAALDVNNDDLYKFINLEIPTPIGRISDTY